MTSGSSSMPTGCVVKPLRRDQIDQAYPLVQLALGDVSIADWRTLATKLLGSGDASGIISLQTPTGHLLGLFCFSVRHDLQLGRTLDVVNFVALPPIRADIAADLLFEEMERLGRRLGCATIGLEPSVGPVRWGLNGGRLIRTLSDASA
jgi:hypothetical protein